MFLKYNIQLQKYLLYYVNSKNDQMIIIKMQAQNWKIWL